MLHQSFGSLSGWNAKDVYKRQVEDADESAQASAKTPADLKALAESLTLEVLEGMTVKELRTVARDLNVTNMTRKEIRFGKKEDLIASICKYLEQEC